MCDYTFFFVLLFCLSVQPTAAQKVDWFPECTTETPDSDELRDWMKVGAVNTNPQDTRRVKLCTMFSVGPAFCLKRTHFVF